MIARREGIGNNIGASVYDDSTKRTAELDRSTQVAPNAIVFTDSSHLYANSNFARMTVGPSGLTLLDALNPTLGLPPLPLVSDGALIYSANGKIVNPQSETIVGSFTNPDNPPNNQNTFPITPAYSVVVDAGTDRAFFITNYNDGTTSSTSVLVFSRHLINSQGA